MSRLLISRFFALNRASNFSHLKNITVTVKPLTIARHFASWKVTKTPLDRKEVEIRVLKSVASHDKVDQSQVKLETHLMNDLGLDSLDHVEVIMAVEDEFTIDIDDVNSEKLFTVNDIVDFVMKTHNDKMDPAQNPGHKLDPNMEFGRS